MPGNLKIKKKKKKKKTKVRAMPGNCPDRQTDRPVTLIYKMVVIFFTHDAIRWVNHTPK
jgi:hypothetical protein